MFTFFVSERYMVGIHGRIAALALQTHTVDRRVASYTRVVVRYSIPFYPCTPSNAACPSCSSTIGPPNSRPVPCLALYKLFDVIDDEGSYCDRKHQSTRP